MPKLLLTTLCWLLLLTGAQSAELLRYAIVDADQTLHCDGQAYSRGIARGLGLAHVPIVDRGQRWEQRPDQATEPRPALDAEPPRIEVWINKRLTALAWKTSESCAAGCRSVADATGIEAYAQAFSPDVWRVSLRVRVEREKPVSDLRIFIYGQEQQVTIEHQAERFPCVLSQVKRVGWLITLADGKSPGTANLEELGWMLGGTIDPVPPAGAIELGYDSEVAADVQRRGINALWRSIDFVVQPPGGQASFGPPLVLERGKWAPLFAGDLETKRDLETQLARQYASLVYSRQGWATFGDWPHEPLTDSKYRIRQNNHYFTVCALYRATVRSQTPELWSDMARVAAAYTRDCCWKGGWQSHGKGLTPYSGPWGVAEHWVDSESLLMAWLVDGDLFAKTTYDAWRAAWRAPQRPARESCVAKRMADVAHAYTGEAVWRERADTIQNSVLADIDAGKPGTGYLWHPEWCDRLILKSERRPEGIINARAWPEPQFWQKPDINGKLQRVPSGAGPIGDGHQLLLMHCTRYIPKVYGANVGDPRDPKRYSTRIIVDKRDAKPLDLHLLIDNRIRGGLHQTGVRVYDPSGKLAYDNQAIELGKRQPWQYGLSLFRFDTSVAGPRGKWTVDVSSYALMLFAPVSDWREAQQGTEFTFAAN